MAVFTKTEGSDATRRVRPAFVLFASVAVLAMTLFIGIGASANASQGDPTTALSPPSAKGTVHGTTTVHQRTSANSPSTTDSTTTTTTVTTPDKTPTTSTTLTTVAAAGATTPAAGAAAPSPWRGAGLVSLPADCSDMSTLGLSWYYDWKGSPPCPDVGVPFVPMVWGDWCPDNTGCAGALSASLAGSDSPNLLTFNEPDSASQSNMTVARALELWPYLEATGMQLSSPAVSDTAAGAAWLASFMAQAHAQGLRVDFLAVHWYGDCSNPSNLTSYLAQLASSYGLPIWLTEFSCYDQSTAVNTQFLQQVAPMLAALPYLRRVAWFTNRPYPDGYENTSLLDAGGTPTSTGLAYQAIPAAIRPDGTRVPWPGS
jgi:hypothetical protein